MRRIIAGGTGLIGKRLVDSWLNQNHSVTVIGRSQANIEKVFGARVQAVTWDKLSKETFQGAEVVVNLAGENLGLKRWTDAQKKEVINSRVETTKKIAELLASIGKEAPALFNASAIGIYGLQKQGHQLPPKLDESVAIDYEHPADFLSEVGRRWEKAADPAVTAGVRVVFLRFGVVLAKEGGALPIIMKPFQVYLGGPIGSGDQPFSWVAIDDVVTAINFLIAKSAAAGPYNIVAPGAIQQRKLGEAIARVLNRPDVVKLPGFMAKLMLGEQMASEMLLEGQRVFPKRLTDDGFKFTYADIDAAIQHLLK